MTSKTTIFFAALAAVSALNLGYADSVDNRQQRQDKRIEQGQMNGSINAQESRALERGQRRINSVEAKAEADGKITAQEKRQLHKMQNRQNQKIHRMKHNRR